MHSLIAVVAGYAVLAVLVGIKFAILQWLVPGAFTNIIWLISIVATDALSAAAAGYVIATLARRRPMAHGVALVSIMVPLGILNAFINAGREPLWFQVAVVTVIAASVPLGVWRRAATVRARPTPSLRSA